MDKNLLLAVSLSMAVYVLWFGFIEKRYMKPAPPTAISQTAPSGSPTLAKESARSSMTPPPAETAQGGETPTAAVARETLEKQSDLFTLGDSEMRVHPQGAAIISYRFRGPLETVELILNPQPGFYSTWPDLKFQREKGPGIVYSAVRSDGMRIRKQFIPESNNELPRLRVTLSNPTSKPLAGGSWQISIGPGLGTVASEVSENESVWRTIGLTFGEGGGRGKIEVFEKPEQPLVYRWVAVDNRYFLAAAIPSSKDFETVASQQPPLVAMTAKNVVVAPGSENVWEVPYYLGAKKHTSLTVYKMGLERSIDFGFFAQLGRFVLQVLNYIHKMTGNWGWAIILLTLLLQIILFPLTYKSLKAAAAMKLLQPEIAKLQQKYSKDPSRLNAETMELYKKSGANPLGGCLPMLMQMPVFIALFNTLRNSWELHGAPWIFWIKDLSSKDPYYVLPLVMGALMFLQNKMNPPTSDPSQAAVMTWMPLIFTFMFLKFPAGLVLYWLTNSVISALQQLALKNHFNPSEGR